MGSLDDKDKRVLGKLAVATFVVTVTVLLAACLLGLAVRLFTIIAFTPLPQ